MSSKRVFNFAIATGTVLVWLVALPGSLFSQDYPSRAIHFITPFPPGPADVVIRLYAPKLSQDWGQSAIIENRPGATGTIGTNAVAQATPDGYTLLFTVDLPITMAPNLLKVAYDPQRDLIPIAAVVEGQNVVVVNAKSGIHSLAELVAAAKAKPGVLTYSSAGNGSPGHLCGAMIAKQAGIDMIHVPYTGAGPSMNAILAGDVTMFCAPIGQALGFIRAGNVVPLGVVGPEPSPLLPEVAPRFRDLSRACVIQLVRVACARENARCDRRQTTRRVSENLRRSGHQDETVRGRFPGRMAGGACVLKADRR